MANNWEIVAAATSIVLRLSAFVFLRWIPGHHFPPLIVTALILYLTIIYYKREAFGAFRLRLHEAFPAILKRQAAVIDCDGRQDVVEVIEVDYNDPIIYEDEYPLFKTLLLGIPDWREWDFSCLTIGLNILVACLALDFVFRGPVFHPSHDLKFSRLGFIDESTAKVLFREPDQTQLPVIAYYKTKEANDWIEAAHVYYLGPETDFTHPLEFTGLEPSTTYIYSLSNDLSGTFRTAPAVKTVEAGALTFLTSSCIKANFPYRPMSHSLAIHGFEHLSRLARTLSSAPAFMMFLGDFIYVDVPQRLSSSFSHYRSEYRRVYASPSWKLPGLDTIPWLHTLDDHEIANDWSGGNQTAPFPAASDPFIHYHVSVNPPIPPSSRGLPDTNTTYFQFTRGPASFFMLDTRRYRTDPEQALAKASRDSNTKPIYASSGSTPSNPPPVDEEPASMLGETQLEALLAFIRKAESPNVHWKIIASSVPFTKNWRFGTPDTWGGFLAERSKILVAMHDAEAKLGIRIVVLSGDRHEFAAIRFPPPSQLEDSEHTPTAGPGGRILKTTQYDNTPQAGPHEFSVGPLSMFYLPIRTFRQVDHEDVAIKYLPDGNSKIGVVEIQNLANAGGGSRGSGWFNSGKGWNEPEQQSLFKYSLWIDGAVAWEYTITSPAPTYQASRGRTTS